MVFCRQATRYSDKITLKHLQRMTFVQIEVEFFRVNSYFIDNLDTQNKQRQMRPLCGSLERFLDTKGHRYSKDVTTIEIVFFCGRYFKARLRPKYIEGKVVKNWRDRDLDNQFLATVKEINGCRIRLIESPRGTASLHTYHIVIVKRLRL